MRAQRRRQILEVITQNGQISVAEIIELFQVSEMTARRDLADLAREGLLRRVHGGATINLGRSYEPPYPLRTTAQLTCKQAIGQAAIQQGYRVLYRETHTLINDIADAVLDGTRKDHMELLSTVPLLIIDDLGMRKLPVTAAEDFLEIVMRRYERTSTMLTSNRPIDDWGKLLGDTAAVTAMLDRLLHHGHVLKCGPRSWRTKTQLPGDEKNEK